ncbi:MAG TPA: N-succinylarginine dihydrolase [Planctomycetota bacterium]|nr:N-succinylarginine dihydrolase [Planctomycetota bacterium]
MSDAVEVQIDGLAGPTHHFAGLSHGNLASLANAGWSSRPRAAARQGLAKMRAVMELGVVQAVLPPLARPDIGFLRGCGFAGDERAILTQAAAEPHLLSVASSSAFMWAANAATVAPSVDTADGRLHLIGANLMATPHRALEGLARTAQLRRLFRDPALATVHAPLPASTALGDEGAANHCRFALEHGLPGVHLLVYGRGHGLTADRLPKSFPARQTREASMAVARTLGLPPARTIYAQQLPAAIDAGAFHNDVVMVANRDRLLVHERALVDQAAVLKQIARLVPGLRIHEVRDADLPLAEAVRSYLFNSQLIDTADGMVLLAPMQSSEGAPAKLAQRLIDDGFIGRVQFIDLGQSMANGGGPACLRLRVAMTPAERASLAPGAIIDATTLRKLETHIDMYYRESLKLADLADPQLALEAQTATAHLESVLGMRSGTLADS